MAQRKNSNNKKNSAKRIVKRTVKVTEKTIEKSAHKPLLTVIAVILIIAIIGFCVYWFYFRKKEPLSPLQTGELTVHFLELGNKYAGDCTLIKIGDIEVLIDAGSRKGSAATIVPYLKQYCTDGVLEYVIATHAHQDHIAAFVGTKEAPGVFDSFECKTIIDFTQTNKETEIYNDYVEKRKAEVKAGAVHYTAERRRRRKKVVRSCRKRYDEHFVQPFLRGKVGRREQLFGVHAAYAGEL